MKKLVTIIGACLFALLLIACNNTKETEEKEKEVTFIGTISEINDQTAIISIEEGEILNSGSSVTVDLSVNENEIFFVGDKVEVVYDGIVREIHPLSINTISVKKVQ